jgi:phosphoglycerol transferase MdoB-like AlkP superfamily enzyme
VPDQIITLLKNQNLWKWLILVGIFFKILLFYLMMQVEMNLAFYWIGTALVLSLFFRGFRNLWIPFGIYAGMTLLMLADLTFNTYFNGYLSVNMMGSSKYLADVIGVIMEVVRPQFFLLFLDLPILALAIAKLGERGEKRRWPIGLASMGLILILILGSLTGSPLLRSYGNMEFFSFHIKDIATNILGEKVQPVSQVEEECFEVVLGDPLFGIAQGRNLIVIQLEAFQNFAIDQNYFNQEISPVLNALIEDPGTLYFDNYYMQIAAGNTSDAEFATNNSLYGTESSYTYEIYKDNSFRGLPVLLKESGYQTVAMHGYEGSFWSRDTMYPAQGFDRFIDDTGYQPTKIHGWGILDEEFYEQSVDHMKEFQQPFYAFLVSLSNHTPFEMEDLFCHIQLKEEHQGTRFGNYLNSVAYSDQAIETLLDELKEAGLYENSIIAFYGDHFGLAQYDQKNEAMMTEFLGKPYRFDEMANIPLIIHIPGTKIKRTIATAGGQMDFLPTIAYLMGFETLDTVYLGQNLITAQSGFVIQNRYAPAGSFITNDVIYFMSFDGMFENGKAWNVHTGEDVPFSDLSGLSEKAAGLVQLSQQYLELDEIGQRYPVEVSDLN